MSIGAFEENDLKVTAALYTGTGSSEGAPDLNQFIFSVADLLCRRVPQEGMNKSRTIVVFVFGSPPDTVSSSRVDSLDKKKLIQSENSLSNRLFFCPKRLGSADYVDLPQGISNMTEANQYVESLKDVLTLPTIVYDSELDEESFRLYEEGVSDTAIYRDVPVVPMEITEMALKKELDRIHKEALKFPSTSRTVRRLWEDRTKHYPSRTAELDIQETLRIMLVSRFGPIKPETEQTDDMGRFDIALVSIQDNQKTYHALLELKVARACSEKGEKYGEAKVCQDLSNGIVQAKCYAAQRNIDLAALCCFDMRMADTGSPFVDDHHSSAKSDSPHVHLWSWQIVATPEESRKSAIKQGLDTLQD